MMAPALIVLAVLSLFPFFYIIAMSLSRVGLIGGIHLTGLGLTTGRGCSPIRSSARAGCGRSSTSCSPSASRWCIGVAVALILWEVVRGRNIALSLILMPMFMAPVIVGLLGRFLTDCTYGLYAWVLKQTGIYSGDIVGSAHPAFIAVVLMDVWEWTPLIALIVLAGLTSVPAPIIEAAKLDGASYWQRFRYIVFPTIAGVVVIALLIRSMDAIRYYDIITNTTAGGPADATKTIPLRLYEEAFRFFDLGYAAAIGLTMLAFSIVVANLFVRALRRRGLAT